MTDTSREHVFVCQNPILTYEEAVVDEVAESPEEAHPFEMKASMSVLEALGINLYSNAAAVISEMVANAWDAEAGLVQIKWDPDADEAEIEIWDDGTGMTQDQPERAIPDGRLSQASYRGRCQRHAVAPLHGA
ncbi:hypothetical protein G5V59_20140 [Nocardioides sp. W3-2-3]|uniref:ATP-binding protein n=1 Tax=Nocardioides convexus TaxID=2712224 RepID=UPI0024189293|nr:ATP-binding protein [Nocardioides convexus]NHA01372.1 hypothetical protein [Nocardioides convexus]